VKRYPVAHLSDEALLQHFAVRVARDRTNTAGLLACLAEVDTRKLYRPAAYPSMFAFCVGEFHMSEDVAFKRIKAARAARRFPAILDALADGRLHLSAVVLLAPHLTEGSAEELLAVATHKTRLEIEHLLAARFPQPDAPTRVEAIRQPVREQAPGPVGSLEIVSECDGKAAGQAPGPVESPGSLPPAEVSRVKPLSAQRFSVQFTMSQVAHDKLRYVQELLSHQVPSGDIAQVFERALDALIPELEKTKFSATDYPRRRASRRSENPRYVPADVRRAVWERDGGQCTFVGEDGHRCGARRFIEFDHVTEVARGGEATLAGLQLRCRAHNQYAAECAFGVEFMRHKRVAAAEGRANAGTPAAPA